MCRAELSAPGKANGFGWRRPGKRVYPNFFLDQIGRTVARPTAKSLPSFDARCWLYRSDIGDLTLRSLTLGHEFCPLTAGSSALARGQCLTSSPALGTIGQ